MRVIVYYPFGKKEEVKKQFDEAKFFTASDRVVYFEGDYEGVELLVVEG